MGQLVGTNGALGQSFRRVDSDEATAERMALRDRLDRAYDKLKIKRSEELELSDDLAQVRATHVAMGCPWLDCALDKLR